MTQLTSSRRCEEIEKEKRLAAELPMEKSDVVGKKPEGRLKWLHKAWNELWRRLGASRLWSSRPRAVSQRRRFTTSFNPASLPPV